MQLSITTIQFTTFNIDDQITVYSAREQVRRHCIRKFCLPFLVDVSRWFL